MSYTDILIINDDDEAQQILIKVLGSISTEFSCTAFNDAEEALFKLDAGELPADLIFLDLQLPGMIGQQFLEESKKNEAFRDACNCPHQRFRPENHQADQRTGRMGLHCKAEYF